jgi:hypothetical protein
VCSSDLAEGGFKVQNWEEIQRLNRAQNQGGTQTVAPLPKHKRPKHHSSEKKTGDR